MKKILIMLCMCLTQEVIAALNDEYPYFDPDEREFFIGGLSMPSPTPMTEEFRKLIDSNTSNLSKEDFEEYLNRVKAKKLLSNL